MTSTSTLSRRNFLLGTLAVTTVGATAVGMGSAFGAANSPVVATATAWVLKTDHWSSPRGNPARTHCKCSACVRHGANKIFATLAAANDPLQRAHPGCLCEPAEIELSVTVWTRLFTAVPVVDRRNLVVAAVLSGASTEIIAAPSISAASGPTDPTSTPPRTQPSGTSGPARNVDIAAAQIAKTRVGSSGRQTSSVAVPTGVAGQGGTPSVSTRPQATGAAEMGSFGLPAVGIATGLGLLLWWRRRGEEDDQDERAAA